MKSTPQELVDAARNLKVSLLSGRSLEEVCSLRRSWTRRQGDQYQRQKRQRDGDDAWLAERNHAGQPLGTRYGVDLGKGIFAQQNPSQRAEHAHEHRGNNPLFGRAGPKQ